jgi:anaerobic selenocysteine-containing dehydrogenase
MDRTLSAVYQGNPTAHNLGLMTIGQLALRSFGTRNLYSATSADQLPHMLAAHHMFGDGLLMPVPDLDRTDFFLCIGANPLVSNGSIMTAPNMRKRLHDIRARGGRVVVVDPRRSETAAVADQHLFIRPGTDALFLLSMIHVIFAERLERLGRVASFTDGLDDLRTAVDQFAPRTRRRRRALRRTVSAAWRARSPRRAGRRTAASVSARRNSGRQHHGCSTR